MTGEQVDDETRWADAESLLAGAPTESALRRLRQVEHRMRLLVGGLVLLGLAAAVLVVVLVLVLSGGGDGAGGDGGGGEDGPLWATVLGLVVQAAGVALAVVGLVRMLRTGQGRSAWRAPALVLTRAQRKDLLHQVRGRRPVDPAHLGLVRDVASRLGRARGYEWLAAGLVAQQVGQAVGSASLARWLYAAGVALLFAGLAAAVRRQRAQAQAFLDDHPEPAAV